MTHELDLDSLTIHAIENGERYDLNAGGEPCRDVQDLAAFVSELRAQGAYGPATERALLEELADATPVLDILDEADVTTLWMEANAAGDTEMERICAIVLDRITDDPTFPLAVAADLVQEALEDARHQRAEPVA